MKKIVQIVCCLLISLAFSPVLLAQEYQYHKVYIYNFTKYIQWPTEKQKGDFVIGVVGKSSMIKELETMAQNRMVGAQKIVVKQIEGPSDAEGCHVLFIPANKSGMFTQFKTQLGGKPVLFVTEKNGLSKEGSDINFVLVDGKLKYEMNKSSLDKAGLKVMPDLMKLALQVNS
jgi:hypothetical protein